MKKSIIALIVLILGILFLSTFIEKNNEDKYDNEDNIVMSVSDLNFSFNKISDLSKDDENIICATSRGLVKCNNNNDVVPDIAENIDISKDGIEYDFSLKDDIHWSDGRKITAEDILLYFKWLIKKENEKDISALLDIYGAKEFKEGRGTFEKNVALTSDGDNIKIRLNKKNDDFLIELSKPQYRIRSNLVLWDDIQSNYKNISYSGDYSIKKVLENEVELKKNDGEGKTLVFVKDENKEDAMASYEIGERDIVVDPPVSQVTRLDKNRRILSSSSGKGVYVAINSQSTDLNVRKEFVRILYRAAQSYYEDNRKAVKFSEGSYFEKDMDELDKLQSRKVSITNGGDYKLPSNFKILIENNDVIQDFSKFIIEYFSKNEDINLQCEKEEDIEENSYNEYNIVIFTSEDNRENKNILYSNMQRVFAEENKKYFTNTLKIEENLFNSYSVVPVMFINKNIAVSDKVSNVKLDANGDIDFSAIN